MVAPGTAQRFAPIEFPHRRDPVRFQKPGKTQGYHEGGAAARGQAAQRGEIQVVVMIVAQQDCVDERQPVEFARRANGGGEAPQRRTGCIAPTRSGR